MIRIVAACCIVAIAGCTARTNVGATGVAPPDAAHLWVTVDEIAFAAEADAPPEATTGWTRKTLSTPVVLDLANVDPDALVPLVTNLSVPAGSYKQLYLGLADPADRLVDVARNAGLDYNAQIEIRKGSGAVAKAPLELPVPRAGLAIPVDLTFKDESGLSGASSSVEDLVNLAVTLDAAGDVVTYDYGSNTGYILSPGASVQDVARAGAIEGQVDTSALPADHPPITVTAQAPDSAGAYHVVVQRRQVAADGSFLLFPLPAPKNGTKQYEVVIACAGADTVIVRDVPVSAGTDPTTVQSTPVALTPARTVYADVQAQSPALPAGTRVEFYQTLPGRDQPYLIDGTLVDPLSRNLPGNAFALASGSLVVGTYAGGNPISFSAATPGEGSGGYVVGTSGLYRAVTLAGERVDIEGGSNRPTQISTPYPEVADGGISGTLAVNVLVPVDRFDAGFIAVSAGHRLMETVSIGALLQRGGGTVNVAGLPAGSALAPVTGVPYRVALRAWNSRNPSGTLTTVAATASTVLGDSGTGRLSLQIQ